MNLESMLATPPRQHPDNGLREGMSFRIHQPVRWTHLERSGLGLVVGTHLASKSYLVLLAQVDPLTGEQALLLPTSSLSPSTMPCPRCLIATEDVGWSTDVYVYLCNSCFRQYVVAAPRMELLPYSRSSVPPSR
jgi:hypothetical protein